VGCYERLEVILEKKKKVEFAQQWKENRQKMKIYGEVCLIVLKMFIIFFKTNHPMSHK
jgi:hypothetical protein